MNRFFIGKENFNDGKATIENRDFNHIKNVLRMEIGEELEISCDGDIYLGKIEKILEDSLIVDLIEFKGKFKENIEINLFQGLAKGSKMDLIIQKGTEIGVSNFYGVLTHRTVVRIKDQKKKRNRLKRWNTIAEEAAKQSKRNTIPQFKDIINFKDMIDILKNEKIIIVPYEEEKNIPIGNILKNIGQKEGVKVNLIIGPEGGFEEEEIDYIKGIGGEVVSLGQKILRTETAGFVASTIILYELSGTGVI